MRTPSRILASATAVLLLAAMRPAAAVRPLAPPASADLPIPHILHGIPRSALDPVPSIFHKVPRSGPDPLCDKARQPEQSTVLLDWWRQWWGTATSRRDARQTDPERTARTPFYLRSPMLSGFFGWGEPDRCDDEAAATSKTPPRHAPVTLYPSHDSAEISPAPQEW